MQEIIEIDIKKILLFFWRWLWLLAICAFIGATAAFAYTRYMIVPKYTSSVSLYVNNNTLRDVSSVNAIYSANDIAASKQLVDTYIVILRDDIVFDRVASTLLSEYSAEYLSYYLPVTYASEGPFLSASSLRSLVSMGAVNETEVLQIRATTPVPELSARICMIIAESASDVLQRVVKAGSVEIISPAKLPVLPSSPSARRNTIFGFIGGGGVAALAVLIIAMLDNTVKNESDVKKRFDIVVLGEIPDFNSDFAHKRKSRRATKKAGK